MCIESPNLCLFLVLSKSAVKLISWFLIPSGVIVIDVPV